MLRVFFTKSIFTSVERVNKKFNQFIRGLVPKKLPVYSTKVLTMSERDRVFYNFYLTEIVIIFDARIPIFTFFYSLKLVVTIF